jgi:two-component system response regulator
MIEESMIEILLVEDNPGDAELAIHSLKKHHLANHLLHLKDGEEALNYLFSEGRSSYPRLILLDLHMPKVNGLEVLKKLKSDPSRKFIPVVILTSSKDDRNIIEAYKLGVNAYIVKPVEFDKLVEAVHQIGYFWLIMNQNPNK